MIVLLPVSRYRVRYHVASGRPYSFFERLILEAITDGHSSLLALEAVFRVHRRALIEGIVTLIQAGWIAIDRNTHNLMPTLAGRQAVEQPDQLPKNIVVLEQKDYVVGERVQGQVAKGTEVKFASRSELGEVLQMAAVIPSGDLPHPLEPGILVPLLRVNDGEWIRACGPIDIVRDGADFTVVDVDTSSGMITGIPSKWVPLLRDELVDRARLRERQLVELGVTFSPDAALTRFVRREAREGATAGSFDPDEWLLDSGPDRIVVGGNDHQAMLAYWLENARSYMGIATQTLDYSTTSGLVDRIRSAVARGVLVDVVWGIEPVDSPRNGHQRAYELLAKLQQESRQIAGDGRLGLARRQTGSRANILFGDVSDTFEAVVGCHDWLGPVAPATSKALSLVVRERGPVARIGRLYADFATADEILSMGIGLARLGHALTDLHRQIASAAEQQVAEREKGAPAGASSDDLPEETLPGGVRARLVVGRQHNSVLGALTSSALERVVVASHRWGPDDKPAFRALEQTLQRGRRVDVRYGTDLSPGQEHEELQIGLSKLGGSIHGMKDIRGNVAVVDNDTAAITSFDWLSPTLSDARPSTSCTDLGFILRGPGIGLAVLEHLGISATATAPTPPAAQYVTAFRVVRLRSVNRIEWALGPGVPAAGWHVIVGDNGSGKTSILRGIALALLGADNASALRQDWAAWLRGAESSAEVEVALEQVGTTQAARPTLKVVIERRDDGLAVLRAPFESADNIVSVGYGPFRRFTGGDPEYEKQLAAVPKLARHLSLFDERVALTESLSWLRELRFKALESDPEASLLLDRVTKLVNESQLIPDGIRLSRVTSEAVIFEDESGNQYPIEELSDGYRSVLSLTFDIVRQLAVEFGSGRVFDAEQPDVITAPAIVLIDEVDAHLHPSWQRTIGQWFHRHFPRTQFIVTTHSPLVCQAAENGSVYRLPDPRDNADVGGMVEGVALSRLIYGNVLEAYTSGAFGEEVMRSETSKELLHRLAVLNRKELTSELSAAEQADQEWLRETLPLAAHTTADEDQQR